MKSKLCSGIFFLSLFFLINEKANAQTPSCIWAHGFGALFDDKGSSIATDIHGNVYTTGSFAGTVDFDPGAGVFNLTSGSPQGEIFISKSDNVGNFVWAKAMSGSNTDASMSITLDASGNIYTTGYFSGIADFDPGPGVFNLTSLGSYDIFISKLDSSGNFVWAESMVGDVIGFSIAVDASGNVYTTGYFYGADFDPDSSGTFNLISVGNKDIFISKLNSSGNFVWAKSMGGTGLDCANSITLDPTGNGIYITGNYEGTADFDPDTSVIYNMTSGGNSDIFISKLDNSGNFVWAKTIGGVYDDIGFGISTDASGNVYITGTFNGNIISKLNSSGNFIWTKTFGGTSFALAVDALGNAFTTGYFSGTTDFDPDSSSAFYLTTAGGLDIFVTKLDSSGNFAWAKPFGGTSDENGLALACDTSGSVYVTGAYRSPTISFGTNTLINADNSSNFLDIFLAKIGSCSAHFTLYADTIPHNWIAVNQASGVAPLTYLWNWDDGNTSTGPTPSHIYNIPGYYNICLTITDAEGCTSTYCDSSTYIYRGNINNTVITINVILAGTTNITEQTANENGVIVYPNPSNDIITIKSTIDFLATEIILFDASGREVMEKRFNRNASFSIKQLNAGIYFYKIKDAKGNEVIGKVVKE